MTELFFRFDEEEAQILNWDDHGQEIRQEIESRYGARALNALTTLMDYLEDDELTAFIDSDLSFISDVDDSSPYQRGRVRHDELHIPDDVCEEFDVARELQRLCDLKEAGL